MYERGMATTAESVAPRLLHYALRVSVAQRRRIRRRSLTAAKRTALELVARAKALLAVADGASGAKS